MHGKELNSRNKLHFSRVKGGRDPRKLLPWLCVTENSAVLTPDPISFHDLLKCPDVILDQLLNPASLPSDDPRAVTALLINEHRVLGASSWDLGTDELDER